MDEATPEQRIEYLTRTIDELRESVKRTRAQNRKLEDALKRDNRQRIAFAEQHATHLRNDVAAALKAQAVAERRAAELSDEKERCLVAISEALRRRCDTLDEAVEGIVAHIRWHENKVLDLEDELRSTKMKLENRQ